MRSPPPGPPWTAVGLGLLLFAAIPSFGSASAAPPPAAMTLPGSTSDAPAVAPGAAGLALLGTAPVTNGTFEPGSPASPNAWHPNAIAYDGKVHRLFVAASNPSPRILVLDAESLQILAAWTIPGAMNAAPQGVAYDSVSDRVVTADGGSGNVSFLNAATGAVVNQTYLGYGTDPVAVAIDPTHDTVAVAEAGAATLALLNGSTGRVGATVTVGSTPNAVLMDPFADRFVVANGGSATVTPVDPGSMTAGASLPVGSDPDALALDLDAGAVLVANRNSANVSRLDPSNFSSLGAQAVGTSPVGIAVGTTGLTVVSDAGSQQLSIFEDTNGTSYPAQPRPGGPGAAIWDPADGHFYVDLGAYDALAVLASVRAAFLQYVPLGGSPVALAAVGGGGTVEIADPGASELLGMNGTATADLLVARNRTVGLPVAVAYADATGRWFAAETLGGPGSGRLDWGNATALLGGENLSLTPRGLAWDGALGELFVAGTSPSEVLAVDPSNGSLNATFSLGPGATAFAPVGIAAAGGRIFLSGGAANASVLVLNASTGATLGSYATPLDPTALDIDPADALVWVADAGAPSVTAIPIAGGPGLNVTVPERPAGLAYDAALGALLLPGGAHGDLVVLSVANGSVAADVPVGVDPVAAVAVPGTGLLAVADAFGGDLAWVGPPPPVYPVTFRAAGLPDASTAWSVVVRGILYGGTGPNLSVDLPNGSHGYTVPNIPGLVPSPSTGVVVVAGRPVTVPIAFGPPMFNATFIESGLPTGTAWWVAIDGQNLSGTSADLVAALANGSYPYRAGTAIAYAAAPQGPIVVAGAPPAPVIVSFAPIPPYQVVFEETGLPGGTSWSVELDGTSASSTGTAVTFHVDTGDHTFAVPSAGPFVPAPASGVIPVTDASPPVTAIHFACASTPPPPSAPRGPCGPPATFNLTFGFVGLPHGLSVGINLTPVGPGSVRATRSAGGPELGLPGGGTSSLVVFRVTNGTYRFRVGAPVGWVPDPPNGTVTVNGTDTAVGVRFSPATVSTASLGIGGGWAPALGALAIAAGVAVAGLYLLRRRTRVRRLTGELIAPGTATRPAVPAPPDHDEGDADGPR